MIDRYKEDGDEIVELHCDADLCYNRKIIKNPSPFGEKVDWVIGRIHYEDKQDKVIDVRCPKHAKKKYG